MGFSEKPQLDDCLESENKRWVLAGVSIRASLKPINTKSRLNEEDREEDNDDEFCSTTPTSKESRIPKKLPCPPAPRKRRPQSKCHLTGVRDFFVPPDLDSVFKLHVKRDPIRDN